MPFSEIMKINFSPPLRVAGRCPEAPGNGYIVARDWRFANMAGLRGAHRGSFRRRHQEVHRS